MHVEAEVFVARQPADGNTSELWYVVLGAEPHRRSVAPKVVACGPLVARL